MDECAHFDFIDAEYGVLTFNLVPLTPTWYL
jgi:hypothetical protein